MLTEGFFLVRDNIPKWWIWMYYIGFHSYSFESFMYNEFSGAQFFSPRHNRPIYVW